MAVTAAALRGERRRQYLAGSWLSMTVSSPLFSTKPGPTRLWEQPSMSLQSCSQRNRPVRGNLLL